MSSSVFDFAEWTSAPSGIRDITSALASSGPSTITTSKLRSRSLPARASNRPSRTGSLKPLTFPFMVLESGAALRAGSGGCVRVDPCGRTTLPRPFPFRVPRATSWHPPSPTRPPAAGARRSSGRGYVRDGTGLDHVADPIGKVGGCADAHQAARLLTRNHRQLQAEPGPSRPALRPGLDRGPRLDAEDVIRGPRPVPLGPRLHRLRRSWGRRLILRGHGHLRGSHAQGCRPGDLELTAPERGLDELHPAPRPHQPRPHLQRDSPDWPP